MSSSSRKYYSYNNTTKLEYTATNGGRGSSSKNAAKNNSGSLKETRRTAPMPAKEKPVSKFRELLSYGVKPWDPDADDFYEALQEALRKMDAQQNQDDCKTKPLTGRNHTDSKCEGTDAKAGGSSSKNYARTRTTITSLKAKLTVTVKDQAKEQPMRKIEDLLTDGFKPCDSEADDFCETLSEARGKFESCRIEDYEFDSSEYTDSVIEPWKYEVSEIEDYEFDSSEYEDSEVEPWKYEVSEIEPWEDEDSDY